MLYYYDEDGDISEFRVPLPAPRERLFVYGTMKEGFRNHARIADEHDTSQVGYYSTKDRKYVMKSKIVNASGDTAPVVMENGDHSISGELYKISTELLWYVDMMEGAPSVYRRVQVELEGINGTAWMYIVDKDEPHFSSSNVMCSKNKVAMYRE